MTSSSLTLTPGESEVTLLYDWVTISAVPKGPHSFLLYGDNKIAMEQAEDLAAEGALPQDWSRALRLRRTFTDFSTFRPKTCKFFFPTLLLLIISLSLNSLLNTHCS